MIAKTPPQRRSFFGEKSMFRELRRKKQALSPERCWQILREGEYGVLALLGDGGYPYAVPLNYALKGDTLLFHCAREGHKLDAVKRCGKASFCVVSRADVTEEEYTTYFESVIAFGQVRVLGEEEKRGAIEAFSDRFVHRGEEERDREIGRFFSSLAMLELRIEHMAGKRAIELVPRE